MRIIPTQSDMDAFYTDNPDMKQPSQREIIRLDLTIHGEECCAHISRCPLADDDEYPPIIVQECPDYNRGYWYIVSVDGRSWGGGGPRYIADDSPKALREFLYLEAVQQCQRHFNRTNAPPISPDQLNIFEGKW